jgi:hypothetical protein
MLHHVIWSTFIDIIMMEAVSTSEMVSFTRLHGATSQKTVIFISGLMYSSFTVFLISASRLSHSFPFSLVSNILNLHLSQFDYDLWFMMVYDFQLFIH